MVIQKTLGVETRGRGTIDITGQINGLIAESGIDNGICNIFIMHTSASLMICENADPAVRTDLETFMQQTVPDGDPMFRHNAEGPDDMPAHVRTVLTDCSLAVPVNKQRCLLGTWQGIYLWEHRTHGHNRRLVVTIYGE